MRVKLPKEKYAVIRDVDEMSERACRAIDRAMLRVGMMATKLTDAGLNPDEVSLKDMASVLSEEEMDRVKEYHDALIVNMVAEWNVQDHLPTLLTIQDVPRSVFEKLAEACNTEFNKTTTFSNAGVDDPKADGVNLDA